MLLYISTNLEKISPSSSDHQLSTDKEKNNSWFKFLIFHFYFFVFSSIQFTSNIIWTESELHGELR